MSFNESSNVESFQKLEVFWSSPKSGPTWVSGGVIRQTDFEVQVETLEGSQTYRLFDHVTVVIQLKKVGADLHANELAYHLISKRRISSQDDGAKFGKSEINFLQELKINQERQNRDKEEEDDDDLQKMDSDLKKKKKSTYQFFQDMHQMGATIPK